MQLEHIVQSLSFYGKHLNYFKKIKNFLPLYKQNNYLCPNGHIVDSMCKIDILINLINNNTQL